MSGSAFEATAPARVDLAGGILDIWPLYLFHPGSVTVSLAIDRRAWCRAERFEGGVRIESKDTLRKVEAGSVAELLEGPDPPLAAWVLGALGIETGVRVVTHARVPADSGLGGSSALAVAVLAAAARLVGRELSFEAFWPLVRDAEAQSLGMPAGSQDHLAALHGGALAVELGPGFQRTARLPVDPAAIEECLMLVAAGGSGGSGIDSWEVFKAQIDRDQRTRRCLRAISKAAVRVREELAAGRLEGIPDLIGEEWTARKELAPAVTTPEIDAVVEIARGQGGAAKACGAGGGGVVAIWAAPGRRSEGARERVTAALREAGIQPFRFRADLRGLAVDPA